MDPKDGTFLIPQPAPAIRNQQHYERLLEETLSSTRHEISHSQSRYRNDVVTGTLAIL
ncbi:uncharacterized protein K441DRAFT_656035 [Cenococcum geophilum 1.58]|uniref:uncharacterized protein n=1 Tax=Cenococcum geophilum 1.58 TaxID=794803 RepID=UPI003590291F|nr:hypothetical protein K441DRAFT_656035 [Cenococcum geophilum 1.58]